jgi:hypothetical protein
MLSRLYFFVGSCLIQTGFVLPVHAAPVEPWLDTHDRGELFAHWNAARGDAYPLDDVERFVDSTGRGKPHIECDRGAMVSYAGTSVHYAGPVLVDPAFRERLTRFEGVVADVAKTVYGRTPRRLRHYGAFSCRASRNRPHRISEHALGNAIDVIGFDFDAVRKGEMLPADLPRSLRLPFQVRIARHWSTAAGAGEAAAVHQRFLRELTRRLEDRPDIFRILIGPGHGNHADHLHFDASPWRYVDL